MNETRLKLSPELIAKISNFVDIANLAGIDSLIIEQDKVRGIDGAKTVFIFHREEIDLPAQTMAISRLPNLSSRLNLLNKDQDFGVDVTINDEECITDVIMSSNSTQMRYRCAAPSAISVPKRNKEEELLIHELEFDGDMIAFLMKAVASMSAEKMTFEMDDSGARIKMLDRTNDSCTKDITSCVITKEKFKFNYPSKLVLQLLKSSQDVDKKTKIAISKNGMMRIFVSSVTLYIIPQT